MQALGWHHVVYLVLAARWTVVLSLVAFVGGGLFGVVVTVLRVQPGSRAVRMLASGYIRIFQGTPLLMQLFLFYFGLSFAGFPLDAWTAVCVALSFYTSAFLAEIWRGCIDAVPRGQNEAAVALSLSYVKRLRLVIAPQALRIALAPTVGFLVQVVKNTSLAAIIGFAELVRAGQVVSNITLRPLAVYAIVMTLYFALCWPLSLLSRYFERRLSKGVRPKPRDRKALQPELQGVSA